MGKLGEEYDKAVYCHPTYLTFMQSMSWASQVVLVVKNPFANAGDKRDADSIPGSGRYPGGGHSNPLQYSCLENPMERGVCWATVHRVAKSWTQPKLLTHTHTHECTSCEMPGWMHHKLESKLLGELPTTLDTTLKAESKEELNTWQEWKKRVKPGLKLNIRKTKVMASGPITSWQTEGKKVEAVTDFIFLGSRSLLVTVIAVTNWKMLAPWNQSYDKPRQHAKKNRDITLLTKVHTVKAMVFPVVMYGCESWTLRKAECWCFQIVVLEKTLEGLFDYKEIKPVSPNRNQSWIFIGKTDAEAPILWPPDVKSWLIGKSLMLGKIEGKRRRGQQCPRWLDSITDSMDINLSKLQEIMEATGPWYATVHGVAKSHTWHSNWTTTMYIE